MQVFKAFAKIAGKKKFSALLYIGIFMIISILMANQSAKDNNFKETKLSICIIDMDNTAASQKLVDYISSTIFKILILTKTLFWILFTIRVQTTFLL